MKSEPDGVSLALMRKIAKDVGMKFVSKSHMFDIKKLFAEKLWPPKPGDEPLLVSCALASERTGAFPKSRVEAYRALGRMRHLDADRVVDDCMQAAKEAMEIKAGNMGDKLNVAVSILRESGIKRISLYPDSGVESIVFFHP